MIMLVLILWGGSHIGFANMAALSIFLYMPPGLIFPLKDPRPIKIWLTVGNLMPSHIPMIRFLIPFLENIPFPIGHLSMIMLF